MKDLQNKIDKIVFRCFAQGQYWGTDQEGKLNPDYKPPEPIDRTEATDQLLQLIQQEVREELERYSEWLGEDEVDAQTGKTNVDYYLDRLDQLKNTINKDSWVEEHLNRPPRKDGKIWRTKGKG